MNYILDKINKKYRNNRIIVALFLGSFVSFMILYSSQPLFSVYTIEYGVSPATSSLTLSVTTAFLAITLLLISFFSDYFDRKKLMFISLFSSSFLCILISQSTNFSTLLILRALQGITLAGYPSIAMAYISENIEKEKTGLIMGIYLSGTAIGGLGGRLITGILTDLFSWKFAFLIIGLFSLLISMWFFLNLPKYHIPQNTISYNKMKSAFILQLTNYKILCLFGLSFILMGCFVTVYNYLGFLLISPPFNLNQATIGFVFVIYLVGSFSSTFMGNLSNNIGNNKGVFSNILLMLVGLMLTLMNNLFIIIIGLAIFTFGFFGSHSIASNWVGSLATNKSQASSLYLFFYYLGSSVIGTSSGLVWKHFRWNGLVLTISILIIFAMILVLFLSINNTSSKQFFTKKVIETK
ncbi:MFS transporter [Alkalihalobacillus sp. MEB130]|uniref:MFS transporter n=1 Tax=Alkalihalobacillus sp. MEB130 TaxID=2976704 RepID=UPI0028DD46A6|nr:MFS transporter [Alkalihalobacillus sp. MEB130]MDT8861013.1 MFS transporter [Alkalihalobacillus sp. MEB130]